METSMVKRHVVRAALLSFSLAAGAAHAQTAPVDPAPKPSSPTTPNAVTPPNGVPRGVIRPNRPVDRGMVTRPPNPHQHKMPVITPPGTAR